MRDSLFILLAVLALTSRVGCIDLGKDVNYYKDYLRGRADEAIPPAVADRMLYFYRTPLQLHPGLLPPSLELEYRKRTGNAFKNHMLSKEFGAAIMDPGSKRSSKAALSLMIGHGKHETYQNTERIPTEDYEIPLEIM